MEKLPCAKPFSSFLFFARVRDVFLQLPLNGLGHVDVSP